MEEVIKYLIKELNLEEKQIKNRYVYSGWLQ